MSDTPDPPRTRTAADIPAHKFSFDERRAGCEAAYRRGTHQAIAFCYDLVEESGSVREALRQLGRAERLAGRLRFTRKGKDRGRGMLLDTMRAELARRRKPAGAGRD
jgi:hypothetical protein